MGKYHGRDIVIEQCAATASPEAIARLGVSGTIDGHDRPIAFWLALLEQYERELRTHPRVQEARDRADTERARATLRRR